MRFNIGDRVHVKRMNGLDTDFYATLTKKGKHIYGNIAVLKYCTGSLHENRAISLPGSNNFGPNKEDYFEVVKDENKGLRWSDGSSAEGTPIMCDEEDSEPSVIQHIRYMNKAIRDSEKYIEQATHDPVNKPSHYMLGEIEVKDIIAIVADKYHKGSVAHNVASALEYQMRAPGKNGLEDIKKARKCLDFAIENWE